MGNQNNVVFNNNDEFNSFFTKAVKKLLTEKIDEDVRFNFKVIQRVRPPFKREGHTKVLTLPFPLELDINTTTATIYIGYNKYITGLYFINSGQWEELPKESSDSILKLVRNQMERISHLMRYKPTIDVEVWVDIVPSDIITLNYKGNQNGN